LTEGKKQICDVVILDDDEGIAELIKRKLEESGLNISITLTYEELVSHIGANRPSLLLLDYFLGATTGREVVMQLTNDGYKIPFIIMTGREDERVAVDMMRLGAKDFLYKDSSFIEMLPSVVEKVISQINIEHELERAQTALKESENKLRIITDYMLDMVCHVKKGLIYEYVSPSYKNILGYEVEELLGRSVLELIHPDFLASVNECISQAQKSHTHSAIETKIKHKDGHYIWIESKGNLLFNENGESIGGVLCSREITQRKEYELALLENEEKYRLLVSTVPDAIIIYNDGVILFSNEAAYDIFGYTKEEMIGKKFIDLVAEEDRNIVYENVKYRTENGKSSFYELQAYKKNGERIDIHVRGNFVKYENKDSQLVIIDDITTRKRIEESLAIRAKLLDSASDSIFILDMDGSILYANNSALKDYGFKRNEILKLNIRQVTVPKEIEVLDEKLKSLYDNGSVVFESVHRQKEGVLVPVEIQIKLNDVNGKILVMCIVRNITERKKAEDTIKYEQDLLHNLMQFMPDTIYFKDVNSRFTRINQAQADTLGVGSPEDAIGKTDFDFFPHYQALAAYDDEQKMLRTGIPIVDKLELIEQKDGNNKWVSATKVPIFDNDGNAVGIVGTSRDISERIQSEKIQQCLYQISEAVNMSENVQALYIKIHTIIKDLMPADNFYIAIYDDKTELLAFPYWVDKYEQPPQPRALSRGLTEYVIRSGQDILVNEEFNLKLKTQGEIELIGNPSKIWLGVPLRIGNKCIGAIVVQDYENEKTFCEKEKQILVFVSEQIALAIEKKQTEEDMRQFNSELRESKHLLEDRAIELDTLNRYLVESENVLKEMNASKDKFFSIVAHDLKSPFNGLLGFTKILVDDFEELSPEMLKGYIYNIYVTAKNVYNLIENLLEWSRIQTGKMEFTPKMIDLSDEVKYTIELLNNNAVNKNISLVGNTPIGTMVCVDSNMIHSVLQNLVSNALKFTRLGGTVEISSRDDGNFVEVTVSDNGIGIKESDIWKIFRIDVQHTTTGTAKEKGTGLGLILCKELIDKHGGKIWVESVEGVGSKFIFTLPKSDS
jgi:PAS domain S-box-containing protein